MENQRNTSLTTLHVRSTDAGTIAEALQSLQQKQLDLRKLIGLGYDGAATFAGKVSGVYKRIQTSSAHAIYIHCSCHRLQLASNQAAASAKEIRIFFNFLTMTSIWKLFYYSPKKAEALKGIQAVLGFPKLKVMNHSDTRWLLHERCVKAISKELPPLLQTLSQLYESSGDAEAYGIYSLLTSVNGVSNQLYPIRSSRCPCSLKLVHAEEDSASFPLSSRVHLII